jgi:hypothetical protein
MFGFGRLAQSNALISAMQLSHEERSHFHQHILEARQYFIGFMKSGAVTKSKAVTNSRMWAPPKVPPMEGSRGQLSQDSFLFSRSPSPSLSACSIRSSDISDGGDCLSREAKMELSQAGQLPNFRIGVYFEKIMQEYGVLWNVNVLFSEDRHRFYKNAVLSTNHRRPKRQLLLRNAIRSMIKSIMKGAFHYTDMEITTQIERLWDKCPNLLENLLSPADRISPVEEDIDAGLASTPSHI